MKKVFAIALFFWALTLNAKTTYIPTYRSYLHIVNAYDTLAVSNNLDTLELSDPDGIFTLRIDHEDVTKEKVKAIKRKKRAAGWASISAALSGVSIAFSDNVAEYLVRRDNAIIASDIADIYAVNAKVEQVLGIDLWIDNNSEGELMVCDMERGLTWWILPGQSMKFKLNNPEAARLRISDNKSNFVRYVMAMAGSKLKKWDIDLETDDYWYSAVYSSDITRGLFNLLEYIRISKLDYHEDRISKEEFMAVEKSMKK